MTTGPRHGFASGLALATAAGLTAWSTLLSWRGFSDVPSRYLLPLFFGAGLIALVGATLRWLRVAGVLVVLAQAVAAAGFVTLSLSGALIPRGEHWDTLTAGLRAAVTTAQTYAAPVPAQVDSIHPLMLVLGMACLLLVDLLACTLRRVPLAGLPLLTIYAVAVSVLDGSVSWVVFVLMAAGFLAMLFLHEDERVARWGRPLGRSGSAADPSGFGVRTGAVRASALGIGGTATALAVLLPVAIPTLDLEVFGQGPGSGDGKVTIKNPMADLRRDLNRGDDIPLLRFATDDPAPDHLRIAVLTRFSSNEWTSGDREIPQVQRADGRMPQLVGVSGSVRRVQHDYAVTVDEDFDSRWLPTTPALTRIDAPGNWRYDLSTMDFLAGDDDTTAAGLTYSMTGVELLLDADRLAASPAAVGSIAERFTALPAGLPSRVRTTALEVTRNEPTRYQKAVALQNWFRRGGGFRYDLARATPGNGTDALLDFLDEKVGYCEQFASAMAVMARTLDIPARVAVGFLTPDRVGGNAYEYSAYDLHAWPELYFPGSGWVLFEPTPRARTGAAPAYTRQRLPQGPSGDPSALPSATASDDLPRRGPESPSADGADQNPQGADGLSSAFVWRRLVPGLAALLMVTALALTPRLLRRWRRRRRWATPGDVEGAWAELQDTCVDLGLAWPSGLSPRASGARIGEWFARPDDTDPPERPARGRDQAPEASAALDRLVHALEVMRYARADGPDRADSLREVAGHRLQEDVALCTRALVAGVGRARRRRAAWWPTSVLRRPSRPASTGTTAVEVVGYGGFVDHVG